MTGASLAAVNPFRPSSKPGCFPLTAPRARPARALPLLTALLAPLALAEPPATPKILWLSYAADHPVSSRWELHFDGSYRPTIGSPARQWMLRPGAGLQITDRLKLSLTYSYFDTHPNGLRQDEGETREHRSHQQIEYSMPWRRTVIRHRFRMEERWLSSPNHAGQTPRWRWQDRPRYMLRLDLPLHRNNHPSVAPVLTLYDEVLFSFASPAASAFEQNRVYTGLTWKLLPGFSLEAGAMHQAIKTVAGPFRHNLIFQMSLRNNLPLRSLFARLGRT